jgi:hypothetical protein
MTERAIVLRTFANEFEAEVARLHLDAAGIPSKILTDGLGGVHPHLQFARGVRLVVPESLRDEAEEALAVEDGPQDDSEGAPEDAAED